MENKKVKIKNSLKSNVCKQELLTVCKYKYFPHLKIIKTVKYIVC